MPRIQFDLGLRTARITGTAVSFTARKCCQTSTAVPFFLILNPQTVRYGSKTAVNRCLWP
jgi:hypothetical protein